MMNKKENTLLILILFITNIGFAQFPSGYGWKVPRKSQKSILIQTIGVTKIEVEYSRPFVNKRIVFGDEGIAPFNKVWRAGANEATTIQFSTDITIDTVKVAKGKYSLFIIPESEKEGTFILNKVHKQWGAFTYNKKHDVLRTKIQFDDIEHQESLLYSFNEIYKNTTVLKIAWGSKSMDIPIKVNLDKTVANSARSAFDWQASFFAAEYYREELKNYNEALKWVNAGLALDKNLSLLNYKAMIFNDMKDFDNGVKTLDEIIEMTKNKKDRRSQYFLKRAEKLSQEWKKELK